MRVPAPILAVTAVALLASPARPQDRPPPGSKDQATESEQKVKQLRKERIAVLKELVDNLTKSFRDARGSYDEVLEAQRTLLEAEVEAAETDAERFEYLQKLVALLRQCEKQAQLRFDAGRGNLGVVFKTTAQRLEAEIRLERVRPKGAEPGVLPRPPDMTPPRPPEHRR